MNTPAATAEEPTWEQHPAAANLIQSMVDQFVLRLPFLHRLNHDLSIQTGTRLFDWVDQIGLSTASDSADFMENWESQCTEAGFVNQTENCWSQPSALLPEIHTDPVSPHRIVIKVESIRDFILAHRLSDKAEVLGQPGASLRKACVQQVAGFEFWIVERHGDRGWEQPAQAGSTILSALERHTDAFMMRRREFENDADGFTHALQLIDEAIADLGQDRTCDLFFSAERRYWELRNRAAQMQKSRQDRLGMGWANHDHHTYRSSRENFANLVRVLERLGFRCRERFYAGEQAGWGAQVLEHSATGVVIFADVDMTPDELAIDFAHEGLSPHQQLGTVGLWCKLHGEAFLEAGMHHLECQFDFTAVREQLKQVGVPTMAPFTDFSYLKQAFTEGEIWKVEERRLQKALDMGAIDSTQAERFRTQGVLGSHLEILERNDGYRGFNQTGISEIIRKTDPRAQSPA